MNRYRRLISANKGKDKELRGGRREDPNVVEDSTFIESNTERKDQGVLREKVRYLQETKIVAARD